MTVPYQVEGDIFAGLESLRRTMGTVQTFRDTLRGLAIGATVGATILGLLHGVSFALPAAFAAIAVGVTLGAWLGTRSWPGLIEAARVVDSHYELQNRVATAVELRDSRQTFATLQRRDLVAQLGERHVQEGHGRWLQWREAVLPAGTVGAFLALLLAVAQTGPAAQNVAAATSGRQIHHVTATQLPRIVANVNHGLTPQARQSAAVRKLNQALARLQRQLRRTSTRANALRTISATQSQLHHIASTLHPVSQKAVAQLNASLGRYSARRGTPHPSSGAQLTQAARTLNRLATSLAHQTPAQRAALAKALAQAASRSSDPGLRSSLQQAASSLAYGDQQSAASALQKAAQAISGTPNAQAGASRLSLASGQLDGLKGQLVQSTGGQASSLAGGKGTGKSGSAGGAGGTGKGSGSGSGKGSGNGKGNGQGSGQGSGSGKGQGQGSGQGSGSGTGQGGTGGHGIGGGQGGSGPHGQGRFATVYAPGKQGKGASTIQTGPNGSPGQVPLVPYRQVLARYLSTAHSSLDTGSIPASRQRYVRQYFSTISH